MENPTIPSQHTTIRPTHGSLLAGTAQNYVVCCCHYDTINSTCEWMVDKDTASTTNLAVTRRGRISCESDHSPYGTTENLRETTAGIHSAGGNNISAIRSLIMLVVPFTPPPGYKWIVVKEYFDMQSNTVIRACD